MFSKTSTKYCLQIHECNSDIVATFSASESERDDWVDYIREAIAGVKHARPEGGLDQTEVVSQPQSRRFSAVSLGFTHVIPELPRKIGELQKKPLVGRFGVKSAKTR